MMVVLICLISLVEGKARVSFLEDEDEAGAAGMDEMRS